MTRTARHPHQHPYSKSKAGLLRRMRCIEGHARGIQRMVEDDRGCAEVIQQLSALSRAVGEVSRLLLQDHIESCVTSGARSGRGQELAQELVSVVRRAMKV